MQEALHIFLCVDKDVNVKFQIFTLVICFLSENIHEQNRMKIYCNTQQILWNFWLQYLKRNKLIYVAI